MKLNGRAHFDDASFLVGGSVEDIRMSLNGIVYFLLYQLMHFDILYKKVLPYLMVKKVIGLGDILIL